MTRGLRIGALFVVCLAATACQPSHDGPSAAVRADRVLVVLIDRVDLAELDAADAPAFDALVEEGSVGLVAWPAPDGEDREVGEHATAGAGAAVGGSALGQLAFGLDEQVAGGTGYRLWTAFVGREPPEGSIVVPYARYLRSTSERGRPRSFVGLLGDALHLAGSRTAVVGNADTPDLTPPWADPGDLAPGLLIEDLRRNRAGALLVADRTGLVDTGEVTEAVLVLDPSAPGGARTDPAAVVEATRGALADATVVVVETGDTTRADVAGADAASRRQAIGAADALLADLLALADETTLVVVAGLSPSTEAFDEGVPLTPLVLRLPGRFDGGLLASSTTRLPGVVSGADLAPTILAALSIDAEEAMRGRPIEVAEDGEEDRVAGLLEGVDGLRGTADARPILPWALLLAAVLLVLAALTGAGRLAVAVTSLPLWVILAPGSGPLVGVVLPVVIAAAVWWMAKHERDRPRLLQQLWVLIGAIVLVDLAFGGRLHRGSPLGPELATGERFGLLSDAAVGLLGAGWLCVAWLLAARLRGLAGRALAVLGTLGASALVGLVGRSLAGAAVVAAAGLAAAWLAPARRLRPGAVALVVVGSVAAVGGVIAIDVAGAGARAGPFDLWQGIQVFGWGEGVGVVKGGALDALVALVTSPWVLLLAATAYAAWDAWPRLSQGTRSFLLAAAVAVGVCVAGTDAGAAGAGWVAVLAGGVTAATLEAGLRAAR